MAKYMIDGVVLDTEKAVRSWEERTYFDGKNSVSVMTGSEWDHQRLHQSRKGRYWLECWSQWQGSRTSARFLSEEAAARWLLFNERPLPPDLQPYADEACE